MPEPMAGRLMDAAWAMQLKAVSLEDPSRLAKILVGAILGCGGWVLSRGATDAGAIHLQFEFERRISVDIYTVLVASGLELSYHGHRRFTELCQCTRHRMEDCGEEIASIDLEVQTLHRELADKEGVARVV